MKRIDEILNHDLFIKYTQRTKEHEKNRMFCRHDLEHFLSVARIAEILNLKKKLKIKKPYIYAAALLHDVGRFRQYEDGTSHEKASAVLAPKILKDSGFDENETSVIVDAILSHRDKSVAEEESLRGILYRADKLSRSCFACPAQEQCNWKGKKKTKKLRF